ncbi:MAG: hypothetical protein K2J77_07510 [Oscillospiraceae bacterium]|nr:hypothetical protein [Oscillospiraceae bacterium]
MSDKYSILTLLTLPERQRAVYKLRIITDLSISDIAAQLKCFI